MVSVAMFKILRKSPSLKSCVLNIESYEVPTPTPKAYLAVLGLGMKQESALIIVHIGNADRQSPRAAVKDTHVGLHKSKSGPKTRFVTNVNILCIGKHGYAKNK